MSVVGKKLMFQVFHANWINPDTISALQRFIHQIRNEIRTLWLLVLLRRLVFPHLYLGFWEKGYEAKAWHVAEFVALSILLVEAGILIFSVASSASFRNSADLEHR
jgi:hypothetical protein